VHIPLSIYSIVASLRLSKRESRDSLEEDEGISTKMKAALANRNWEAENPPPLTPGMTPMTPRTHAFNLLGGSVPMKPVRKVQPRVPQFA
jgi:hypothetical protein